jgi:UDP-glucose 4-epimerase
MPDAHRKKYLITGGAGFVGSHLCGHLLGAGHEVVVLDDLSTGRASNLDAVRRELDDPRRLQFVRDGVENESTVAQLMAGCDAVFHLAAAVGVQLILDQPVHTIRTIIRGTEVVLEQAFKWGRPVVITSSSEVYGKGSRVPFSEDDDIVMGPTAHARWCYAYAKGIDEFLALAYHKEHGLPATVARLFNTVGPRQVGRYGMVVPRFVKAALRNEPLQVYGDGEQTRCFCHVADVAAALAKLINRPTAAGRVFNLGSDEEVSIADLARRVVARLDSKSPIEHLSYEAAYGQQFDDLPRRVPNLSRIESEIGFRPTRDLNQIIDDVALHLRQSDAVDSA